MDAKEKKEIIEVFETYIGFLKTNLEVTGNFLCLMNYDITKLDNSCLKSDCGFNNRMLPNAINYLISQRPTAKMNRVIYNKPCFNKDSYSKDCPWWDYGDSEHNIIANTEKIEFLNHLISKLKK